MTKEIKYEWITIKLNSLSPSGKTAVFSIYTNKDDEHIGAIRWNSSWRKYWFLPDNFTGYEEDCLLSIAEFLVYCKNNKSWWKE